MERNQYLRWNRNKTLKWCCWDRERRREWTDFDQMWTESWGTWLQVSQASVSILIECMKQLNCFQLLNFNDLTSIRRKSSISSLILLLKSFVISFKVSIHLFIVLAFHHHIPNIKIHSIYQYLTHKSNVFPSPKQINILIVVILPNKKMSNNKNIKKVVCIKQKKNTFFNILTRLFIIIERHETRHITRNDTTAKKKVSNQKE